MNIEIPLIETDEAALQRERALLATVLQHPETLADARGMINEDTFEDARDRAVWQHIEQCQNRRQTPDFLTVGFALQQSGAMPPKGVTVEQALIQRASERGRNPNNAIATLQPPTVDGAYYNALRPLAHRPENAKTLFEEVWRRSLRRIGQTILVELCADLFNAADSAPEMVNNAADRLSALAGGGNATLFSIAEAMQQALQDMQSPEGTGVKSGMADLDTIVGGYKPGSLNIIAAATGDGKSALALDMAINMARAGVPTLIFTFEMLSSEFGERALANITETPRDHIAQNVAGGADTGANNHSPENPSNTENTLLLRMRQTIEESRALPLWLDHGAYNDADRLYNRARALMAQKRIRCLFIDHLHLMGWERNRGGEAEKLAHIVNSLKRLAQDTGATVFLLSQLSRSESEKAANASDARQRNPTADNNAPASRNAVKTPESRFFALMPRLWQLKGSSAIEQAANTVTFIYRPERLGVDREPAMEKTGLKGTLDGSTTHGKAYLIVAKNRAGECGMARMLFLSNQFKFVPAPAVESPESGTPASTNVLPIYHQYVYVKELQKP